MAKEKKLVGSLKEEIIAGNKDNSAFVYQGSKIDFDLKIREYPWTPKQKEIIDTSLSKDHKMTIADCIWGSGKSLMAMYCCLKLLQDRKISNILYIRNIIQSGSGTLGWLGGSLTERISPWALVAEQKLNELLPPGQVKRLMAEKIVETHPMSLLRGTSYNACGIIIDEASCAAKEDLMLSLSRVGKFCHVFLIGDAAQADIANPGFRTLYNIFDDQESKDNGIHCFELQEEIDVMRSEFLRFVMKKVRQGKRMFPDE